MTNKSLIFKIILNIILYFIIIFFISDYIVYIISDGYKPIYSILIPIKNEEYLDYDFNEIFNVIKISCVITLLSLVFLYIINKRYLKESNSKIFSRLIVTSILVSIALFLVLCIIGGMHLYFLYILCVVPIILIAIIALPLYQINNKIVEKIYSKN